MKSLIVVLLLCPASLLAQSAFDGTWKVNLDEVHFPKRADVYMIQDGTYTCDTCVPRLKIKADGQDHPVAGSTYFESASVRVLDDRDLEITEKEKGKVVYSENDGLSTDGNQLTEKITDTASPNGEPVTAEEIFTRVSAAPAGANAISGGWQMEKVESEKGMTVTYHSIPDGLEASNRHGEGYSAKFDGKEYPIQGDPAHNTVSLKRVNAHTIVETDREDGAIHYQLRMTISRDGKSMLVQENDHERGTKLSYVMEKQ
jgi:hypothetical protein